jgi:hypothetical protein
MKRIKAKRARKIVRTTPSDVIGEETAAEYDLTVAVETLVAIDR